MPIRPLLAGLASAALAVPAVAGLAPVRAAESPAPLGLTCSTVTTSDQHTYRKCTGEVPSFDGIGLDTDLSLPADWDASRGPLPTIVMLHGWSGDKTDWEADSQDGDGADRYHWNNVWFATNGWAVVNYTARGFKESCGVKDADPNCPQSGTHLADRRWETRDSQTLLGDLVDAGVAEPSKLAATGGSYGGGQSWLLATSLPWRSPRGTVLQLAAAVPKYPWTDLLYALTPNGRATDAPYHTGDEQRHARPFGIMKASYVSGLYAVGRAKGEGRYDAADAAPDDPAALLDAEYTRITAGEPYDGDPATATFAADFSPKSPYESSDAYLAAVKAGTAREVPVMSIQGWTDPLFPAVETVQMYRKLKAADPKWPVDIAFGDVGHANAQNPAYQWTYINGQANQFLNTHVLGQGQDKQTDHSFAFVTSCDPSLTPPAYQGTGWDDLHNGVTTVPGSPADTRSTTSAPTAPQTSLDVDPITHGGCQTAPAGDADTSWSWRVGGDFTLVGMPELKLHYTMSGADATPAFYLWDVDPRTGTRTLVTRGEWRLSAAGGDASSGDLDVKLNGNGWEFRAGHALQLQVTQADTPYLRPDNLPSQITWSLTSLGLPTHESSTASLTPAP